MWQPANPDITKSAKTGSAVLNIHYSRFNLFLTSLFYINI